MGYYPYQLQLVRGWGVDKKWYGCGFLIVTLLSGVGLGVAAGFSIYAVINDGQELKSLMYRWQSLIAGFLAFLASLLLFCSAIYSEFSKRRSKFFVARAFLPHSLVRVSGYLEKTLLFYANWYCKSRSLTEEKNIGSLEAPVFPLDVFDDFKSLAEYSERRVALVIARLISDLQVISSRVEIVGKDEDLLPIVGGRYEFEIVAVAFLSVVVDRFYDYSRSFSEYDFYEIKSFEIDGALRKIHLKINKFDFKYKDLNEAYRKVIEGRGPEIGFFSTR